MINTSRPMLQMGCKGEMVSELQTLLRENGSLTRCEVSGDFGAETEASVRAFQNEKGLPENGLVTNAVWDLLLAPNAQRPQH